MKERLDLRLREELPDPRSFEQRELDRPRVARQTRDLARLVTDAALREELFTRLRVRRSGREDLTQFETVRRERDAGALESFVVAGEVLLGAKDAERDDVKALLGRSGTFRMAAACEELGGRVARARVAAGGRALDALGQELQAVGARATVHYITPLGPVIKGVGGPEPLSVPMAFRAPVDGKPQGDNTVALIDTGIPRTVRADGWLGEVDRRDDNIDLLDAFPAGRPDGYLDLAAGHGTFAAGVVRQVAPDAPIVMYRAMDSDGVGSELAVACAMVRAVREGARILNLSLGAQTLGDEPPLALTAALDAIAELPGGRDVLIVAAAGNYGDERPVWPAAFAPHDPRVVAVAALTPEETGAEWSSRGQWVTCSTVGEGVVSTYVEGREWDMTEPHHVDVYGPDAWALWSGTSFAAPQFAGAVARTWRQGAETPRQALDRLLQHGTDLPGYGTALPLLPVQ